MKLGRKRLPFSVLLWIAFLVMTPFYFLPSGMPQLADGLMVLLLLLAMNFSTGFGRLPGAQPTVRTLSLFVAYVAVITLCWMPWINLPASKQWIQAAIPAFYVYNAMVFSLVLTLFRRFGAVFVQATSWGLAFSFILQLALLPISMQGTDRHTLFFNNPNQLGYYSLLSLTLFLYLERYSATPTWLKMAMYVSGAIFVAASSSKAAIISLGLLVIIDLAHVFRGRLYHLTGSVVSVLIVCSLAVFSETGQEYVLRTESRLERIGKDQDDSAEGRGYDRIWLHPEHLLLGAGEGGYDRFDSVLPGEMHSSLGTIVFCYGIPGTLLFVIFLWRVFSATTQMQLLYAGPSFAYGLTHMGLRVTFLWVFFAFVLALGLARQPSNVQQRFAPRKSRLGVRTGLPYASS